MRQIIPAAFRSHRQYLGLEGIYIHDAVALVAAIHPELFTTMEWYGDVETAGDLTVGTTVFDRRQISDRQPNMEVAIDVDAEAVMDTIMRGLKAAR